MTIFVSKPSTVEAVQWTPPPTTTQGEPHDDT
jgi:hypothetical protein